MEGVLKQGAEEDIWVYEGGSNKRLEKQTTLIPSDKERGTLNSYSFLCIGFVLDA